MAIQALVALAAFRADPQRFDLALIDEVMPEMRGTQVAAVLHQTRPELPVLLMTGYSGLVWSHEFRAMGICDILKKPLRSRDIAEILARHHLSRRDTEWLTPSSFRTIP
jgi:DNA-binding NtrC family response regulator